MNCRLLLLITVDNLGNKYIIVSIQRAVRQEWAKARNSANPAQKRVRT